MPGPSPSPITVSDRQRALLQALTRQERCEQRLLRRVSIILALADGLNNGQCAHQFPLHIRTVRQWRARWLAVQPRLAEAEAQEATDRELLHLILHALGDAPRPGKPPKFTPCQVILINAVACTPPPDTGVPVSHWSAADLAAKVIDAGIVETISPRTVGRLLKGDRPQAPFDPLLAHP